MERIFFRNYYSWNYCSLINCLVPRRSVAYQDTSQETANFELACMERRVPRQNREFHARVPSGGGGEGTSSSTRVSSAGTKGYRRDEVGTTEHERKRETVRVGEKGRETACVRAHLCEGNRSFFGPRESLESAILTYRAADCETWKTAVVAFPFATSDRAMFSRRDVQKHQRQQDRLLFSEAVCVRRPVSAKVN